MYFLSFVLLLNMYDDISAMCMPLYYSVLLVYQYMNNSFRFFCDVYSVGNHMKKTEVTA